MQQHKNCKHKLATVRKYPVDGIHLQLVFWTFWTEKQKPKLIETVPQLNDFYVEYLFATKWTFEDRKKWNGYKT